MENQVATSPFEDTDEPILDEPVEEGLEESDDEFPDDDDDAESYEEYEDDEDSDDDELDDEESDDDLEELLEEIEEEDVVDTVPHAALHKERERRKEVQQTLAGVTAELGERDELVGKYKESLDSLKKQLKDLDLLDVVNIDEPKGLDPEVAKIKAAQQQQEQQEQVMRSVADVRSEAADVISEYPMVDGDSPEQAEIVVGLALANIAFGMEQEDAVHHAMKLLNGSLAVKKKAAIRTGKPTPVRKRKRVQPKRSRSQAKVSSGNVSDFFSKMAEDRL